ncbi:MAG: LysR family transcriptional regulator [Candidatus Paracaedibacteraceae bacterium]|nr:LysR family transcriptional regulator [Candidatus Paracaedibacteraceae bacterium]
MRRIELSKLRLFYEIAKEKNMTRAAEKLNITQPALSKALILMEERIQNQLFDRIPTGMRLTPQGERLYLHAKEILEKHELFQREFLEKADEISGDLEIVTYPYIGPEWLIPRLDGFLEKNPKINMIIRVDADNISPIDCDVAIGSFIPNQPYLIQNKLEDFKHQFYASKGYLAKFGIPQVAEDLDFHRIITYKQNYYSSARSTNTLVNIGRSLASPRKPYFQVDSLHGMLKAALKGYGIAELTNYPEILNSGLEIVLPQIKTEETPLYFIFHESRKKSKKIQSLYNYLLKKVKR